MSFIRIPKKISILIFFLLSVLVQFPDASAQDDEVVDLVLTSINCSSGPYKPILPNTIKGYRSLGKRNKEQIQPASDYSGDPKTHTSAIFWYDRMVLSVVFRNQKPFGYFLESATFSHPRWNRFIPIKVGVPIQPFIVKNKLPSVPPQSTLVRICGAEEGAPDCVELSLNEGVVTEVKYVCYTG